MPLQVITLGGGCFWCLEAVFQRLKGVQKVVSGYAGGQVQNPSYKQVCTGTTGHAEVVQIHFDPEQLDYATLLEVFFTIHDPTTPNRQGNDVGPQYRSIILYTDAEQQAAAQQALQKAAADWPHPLVTEVKALHDFYAAEDDHQNYYNDNPQQPYCSLVVAAKVRKFEQKFAHLIQD